MNPIEFPEQTTKLAKTQPQYRPLPVAIEIVKRYYCPECNGGGTVGECICDRCKGAGVIATWSNYVCKYELSDLEIEQIIRTRSVYLSQSGHGFNPIYPSVESQFKCFIIHFDITEAGLYNIYVPMDNDTTLELLDLPKERVLDAILSKVHNVTPDTIRFVERPKMAIDEQGNVIDI